MNKQEFVKAIKESVIDGSIDSMKSVLLKPAGRKPALNLIQMSTWFNKLSEDDKNIVLKIVGESIEMAVFGFLCVLEDTEKKGELKLIYTKNNSEIWLNDPNENYLHNEL